MSQAIAETPPSKRAPAQAFADLVVPPPVVVPPVAATDGLQPLQPLAPPPVTQGPVAGSSGLDTTPLKTPLPTAPPVIEPVVPTPGDRGKDVWADLENQAPPVDSTAQAVENARAELAARTATPTPPPAAAVVPPVVASEPPAEPAVLPRAPGELTTRRVKPSNEIENAAINLRHANPDMDLATALATAYSQAGVAMPGLNAFGFAPTAPAPAAAPVAAPAPTPAPAPAAVPVVPDALAAIDAELLSIREQLSLNSMTFELDADQVKALAVREHQLNIESRQIATQQAVAQVQTQSDQQRVQAEYNQMYERTYDASVAGIAAAFPGLQTEGSPMYTAYVAVLNDPANAPLLADPARAPMAIAMLAYDKAGITPNFAALGQSPPAAPTPPVVSSPQPPANRPPASLPGILPGSGSPSTAHQSLAPESTLAQWKAGFAQATSPKVPTGLERYAD